MKAKQLLALGLATLTIAGTAVTTHAAQMPAGFPGQQGQDVTGMQGTPPEMTGMQQMPAGRGGMGGNVTYATSPSEIVESEVVNTAKDLTADEANATTITMSDSNNSVEIDTAGTYIVTGSCDDGNIKVKKGTTGVVLILKDLTLTSKTGATLSCNKNTEVKIIVEGNASLTDAEDPADETSTDTAVVEAFDGAALKVKDGSNVYLTGDGTLTIDGSACKNGIKVGDAENPSFVIDGGLTVNINAANDAINSGYDLTILSGTFNIKAGDDAIHADRILTIGTTSGSGPVINISECVEGFEGTVVNLFGGTGTIKASDDGVNAANSDGTYNSEMTFSINITDGTWTVNSGGDSLDSNGNVNITGGLTTLTAGFAAGEAGIDYDGQLYVADGTLVNNSGISGPDMMPGNMTGQPTEMTGQPTDMAGQPTDMTGQPAGFQGQPAGTKGTTYTDVDGAMYYAAPIAMMSERGLMQGTGDGMFSPEVTTNRAMFATVLWRLAGSPQEGDTTFSDVESGEYYEQAVKWAASRGIINGNGDGTFSPYDTITRQQMAAMLYRYAKTLGVDLNGTDLSSYTDASDVASYAKEAMEWAAGTGLIKGTTDSTLSPDGSATRGQIATILSRFCDNYGL